MLATKALTTTETMEKHGEHLERHEVKIKYRGWDRKELQRFSWAKSRGRGYKEY